MAQQASVCRETLLMQHRSYNSIILENTFAGINGTKAHCDLLDRPGGMCWMLSKLPSTCATAIGLKHSRSSIKFILSPQQSSLPSPHLSTTLSSFRLYIHSFVIEAPVSSFRLFKPLHPYPLTPSSSPCITAAPPEVAKGKTSNSSGRATRGATVPKSAPCSKPGRT